MLTANRRHRLLFVALAGMDVAATLPFVLAVLARPGSGAGGLLESASTAITAGGAGWALAFFFFWAILLGYLLAADLLNRRHVESPWREAALFGLVLATTLLAEWLLVYGGASPVRWLGGLGRALLGAGMGARPVLVLFAYNLFLWWRVAAMTGRDLGFFGVGLSFRLGMLAALVGNGILALRGGPPYAGATAATGLLWAYFAAGLVAAALARMDDEALMAGDSTGALLPWGRFTQLLLAVAATLGAGAALSAVWSPGGFGRVFGWLSPVTGLLFRLLQLLLVALIWLMTPLMLGLEWLLSSLRTESATQQAQPDPLMLPQGEAFDLVGLVQQWALLRYCLVAGGVALALGLIWLFFVRTQAQPRRDEPEEAAPDEVGGVEASMRRRWRLAGLLGLVRRYGLGPRLLAAISVQNIYANVSRLAARRGFARPPALSPDDYLSRLELAFPGEAARLARLTDAYLRVHYGDEPASPQELAVLREDYAILREEADKMTG
jgi:hypothetical protein